jgi:predicted protein tyrosine phosphatase
MTFIRPTDFSLLVPRLYVGRAPRPGISVAPSVRTVVLAAREYQPPDETIWESYPGARVLRCPLKDIEQDFAPAEARCIARTVHAIKKDVHQGRAVLITCVQGINRAPLLAAIAIKQYFGFGPRMTIDLIRQKRHPECLYNRRFIAYALRNTVRLP